MIDDETGGAFSLDLIAALSLFSIVLLTAVCLSVGSVSAIYTESYASEQKLVAGQIGDVLIYSQGSPPDWHIGPNRALDAEFIGLSDGRPCMVSSEKAYSLSYFNALELRKRFNLDEEENPGGVRIEITSDDGTISTASGYCPDGKTADVFRSVRLVMIRQPDGVERPGKVTVLLWREHAGSKSAGV